MILARWKGVACKSSSEPRRLAEIVKEIGVSTNLVTEEDFKPQKAGSKKGSTNGQTWEVDVGREWISSEHQTIGKQVANDPQDLKGDDWADTATPPVTSSPRKNLELPLTSKTSNMGMILLSAEERQKNTFEGNKSMFLGTLDEKAWRNFLSEFNHETKSETTLDNFKEELWNTVVKFEEPVLMGTGLDEKARKELLSKMVKLRETR